MFSTREAYTFYGLLWGSEVYVPLLGLLPGHGRAVDLARNQHCNKTTSFEDPSYIVLP